MPKKDWNPNTGKYEERGKHDTTKATGSDDGVMTDDEVQAEGGLAAVAAKRRKEKKNSAGSQGDALKSTPTPTPRSTPTRPKSGSGY